MSAAQQTDKAVRRPLWLERPVEPRPERPEGLHGLLSFLTSRDDFAYVGKWQLSHPFLCHHRGMNR